jgi:putative nucleotidyltransferase with HDIG domain
MSTYATIVAAARRSPAALRHVATRPIWAPGDAERRWAYAAYALIGAVTAAVLMYVWRFQMPAHTAGLALLVAARMLADYVAIEIGNSDIIVPGDAFYIIAVVAMRPGPAALFVVVASLLCPIGPTRSWAHRVAYGVTLLATGSLMFAGARTAQLLAGLGGFGHDYVLAHLLMLVGAMAGSDIAEMTWHPFFRWAGWGDSPRATVAECYSGHMLHTRIVQYTFDMPAAIAAIFAYHLAPWSASLFILPYYSMSHLANKRIELTHSLERSVERLATANLQFAAAMVHALDARDSYTAGHSAAVAVYSRDIARELGFAPESCRTAHLAGLLHDVGKIGVPGHVLNKRGKLDPEELQMMQDHAAIGAAILGEVNEYSDMSVVVRHHHERFDGKGYPDELSGESIPMLSRVVAVADTYSAMTTDRPYRAGLDPEIAINELSEGRGMQWDADVVSAFLRVLARASDDYKRGKLTDFVVEVAKHQAFTGLAGDDLAEAS